MLITLPVLRAIQAGDVDTLFRRQVRPTVRTGGTLRTGVGVLDILAVDRIDPADVTDDDARRAGMRDREEVLALLDRKPNGDCYRVRVRVGGEDPRLRLRADDALSDDDVVEIARRLDRMDARSTHGPWTRRVLALIADAPHVRATDLAARLGRDTPSFKADVRRLKELGLTISHRPGYELSPRGRVFLQRDDRGR